MTLLFLTPPGAATFTRPPRLQSSSTSPRRAPAHTTPTMARSPWPVARFLSNFIFYTPLGKLLRGAPSAPTLPTASIPAGPVLVTGASGNTGRRVVATLLSRGYSVRVLTRSRSRLDSALSAVGIDSAASQADGRLSVVLSDLYNIPPEALFGISAVISSTGVKTGPVDDDADRSKYTQGIKFYPPVILEDTPKNVELVGVSRLAALVKDEFDAVDGTAAAESLFDFNDADAVRRTWGSLDDVVMGGVSESSTRAYQGALVFEGNVSTNNSGGFTSTRTADFDSDIDLSAYIGLQLRVRGDGNRYKFIVRCERVWDGPAHCVSFDTKKDEWMVVNIPFSAFNTVFRGNTVQDGTSVDPKRVVACQLMLSKFEYDRELNPSFAPGRFSIAIDSIRPYIAKPSGAGKLAKFVHLSSAAVTRPQRLAEVQGTSADVAILQLNEQIGRLLDWKLAGEDAVRTSGIPYAIVRSTALTIEDRVGIDRLKVDQGDLLNGRVARDDIAEVLASALEEEAFCGVTFETASISDDEEGVPKKGFVERVGELKRDSEVVRAFGPFPYVPAEQSSATA